MHGTPEQREHVRRVRLEFIVRSSTRRAELRTRTIDGDPDHPLLQQARAVESRSVAYWQDSLRADEEPRATAEELIREHDPMAGPDDHQPTDPVTGWLPVFATWVGDDPRRLAAAEDVQRGGGALDPYLDPTP